MDNLKDVHKVFCKEYVKNWCGVKAYQIAYPKSEYSSAKVSASKLLTNVNIQQYIEHIQKDLSKLCGVSVLSNVNLLLDIVNSDSKDSDKIRSIEVINRMLGLNSADKTETNHSGNVSNEPSRITFTKKS
tara:strand:+ start:335 stop:724 length:390 start_codon:yes stop_codon:yes gene_type:complete